MTSTDPTEALDQWRFGQHEALWGDPAPVTPEGQRLCRLFRDGKLGPSPSGLRDFGQRICQIEDEAARSGAEGLDELRWAVDQLPTVPGDYTEVVGKTGRGPFVSLPAVRDILAASPMHSSDLHDAAVFMLDLVDQVYGTDHEPDPDNANDEGARQAEADYRRHRAVILAARLHPSEPQEDETP